jgi:signal transduction histidine kinase
MNFDKAESLYHEVSSISHNEIELLIADVGLMKIYQRTSMNELFYKKRNDARKKMKRIEQDAYTTLKPHDIQRYNYACSEFYITSAIYYYYLQQRDEAIASLASVNANWLKSDSCQWMFYHYLRGSASLCSGATLEEQKLNCFDELYTTWQTSVKQHIIYFEANSLQSMSDLLCDKNDFDYYKSRRGYRLDDMNMTIDTLMSLNMANKSLSMFKKYDDPYQIAGSLVSMAKYYNQHGRYDDAYTILVEALKGVNEHHQKYYHHHKLSEQLLSFAPGDTINRELRWINSERTKTVPEWLLSIREQLSVAYAGLGNKMASDYNRNAYLDILNYTRQDKELENRYNALRSELDILNIIFIVTIIGVMSVIILLLFFNRHARKKDRQHNDLLRYALDECRHITTFTSEEAGAKMKQLGEIDVNDKDAVLLKHIIMPYLTWVADNRKALMLLSEEHERLNKQKFLSIQHIRENKRQNMIKKTCLSIVNGINPYIDRVVNEIHKLNSPQFENTPEMQLTRLTYIDELISTINNYNEILTQWIRMKQGSISLSIESFSLEDLFDLLKRSRRSFELKHQQFIVDDTSAIVKADKALTLFMINTLADNARKYTQEHGQIHISAKEEDKYVEISIADNGRGLSESDIHNMLNEKIYDSSKIGLSDGNDVENLKKNKGSGFGIINCKGIIEKYKKTNALFNVCLFNIESTPGKGSRFYFRLPRGVKHIFMVLLCSILSVTFQSCRHENEMQEKDIAIDSIAKIEKTPGFEILLNKASHYADLTYYSNVDKHFDQALLYADSAITCLNEHYKKYSRHPKYFMKLKGDGTPAEIYWWNKMYDSDFHVILDVRNEAAVAFLALKKIDGYRYNNDAYTSLYKLFGEDKSLGEYCRHLQKLTTNKTVELSICFILLITTILGYYFLFVRKRMVNRTNMEQVFAINEMILNSSLQSSAESDNNDSDTSDKESDADNDIINMKERMMDIPKDIVSKIFDPIYELIPIERIGIAVHSNQFRVPAFVCNPHLDEMPDFLRDVYEDKKIITKDNLVGLPLVVDTIDGSNCVGALYIELRNDIELGEDILLLQIIAEYMAIVVLNSILNLASDYRNIEWVQEDIQKADYEDSLLHVQNMVLDNCLSTIKHETIYYPNKIKQIVSGIIADKDHLDEEKDNINSINELIVYYRDIFTILHSCASRQLEEVTFKRSAISVQSLVDYAQTYFNKKNKADGLLLELKPIDNTIMGDVVLLQYLIENLLNETLADATPGQILFKASDAGHFIRFDLIDTRRSIERAELNKLFYPHIDRMDYLICRQIIREHDDFVGFRGCRINAEPVEGGGYSIYFTLIKNTAKYGKV